MLKRTLNLVIALAVVGAGARAAAQNGDDWDSYPPEPPEGYGPPGQDPKADESPPIPPYAEGPAVAAPGGGYCYVGPHPVDTRVEPGPPFDETRGAHMHRYAPIDLRLFSYRDGCYYFVGDPNDFGYGGQVYSYYGAHPVLDDYGGGWCFMMGGHNHLWQPWSPFFTVVGSWYYWQGAYDPFFWAYWPYYSFYYRQHYPHYYGGGRWNRERDHHIAPPINNVPRPGRGTWRGVPARASGNPSGAPTGVRGGFSGGLHRGAPPTAPAAPGGSEPGRWGAPPTGGTRIQGQPATAPSGGFRTGPSFSAPRPGPSFSAPRPGPSFSAPRAAPAPHSGGGVFRRGH